MKIARNSLDAHPEYDLEAEARTECARCNDIAPPQYDEDELEDEGWHVIRAFCVCEALCPTCFDDERDQCDAYRYDMGQAA
ncbi:hypothetical protein AB0J38_14525 [Streptomyces sp. NPDC050095]|uniref:hypothetical protein n=1 Tax=unclassified Streptomyces TaxID=2593676 RepID=UPI0034463081